MKELRKIIIVLLTFFSLNLSAQDTINAAELFTIDGKTMFSENFIVSNKMFCRDMCFWVSITTFDTLPYKAWYNNELFTGVAENFENDTLVGRFTFDDGKMIRAFITYTDGSNFSIQNFNNMLRDGEDLNYWYGKLSHKTHYKNGVAQGSYFGFHDWFDFGFGYLRVHGQYKDGKKDGYWIYSSAEEQSESNTKHGEFNNLEQQGEIQWIDKYEDGELLNGNRPF